MTHIEQMIHDMCPHGVEWKKLGEVAKRNKGMNVTAAQMKRIENANGNVRIFAAGNTKVDALESDIPTQSIIRVPSIIIKSRGNVGFEYYDKPFTHKNEMWSYSNFKGVNIKFVYYYLQNLTQLFQQKARANSVKLPQLCVADTDSFDIPVPPLIIQEKIVKCLDAFSALAAELQAELQKRRTQYEYYRTLLLAPPHADSVGDSTDGCNWEWKTLGEVCELVTKQTGFDYSNKIKPALLNEPREDSVPFLQTRNFSGRDFDYNTEYYVPNEIVDQFPKIVLDKECLLLSIVGASIGNVGLFPGTHKCFLGGAICVLKFKEGVNIPYVYEYMSSCYGQKLIQSKIKGAGQATITIEDIRNFKIPFPPRTEQDRIAGILGRFGTLTGSLIEGLPAEMALQQKRYEYYRDLLLTFERKAE